MGALASAPGCPYEVLLPKAATELRATAGWLSAAKARSGAVMNGMSEVAAREAVSASLPGARRTHGRAAAPAPERRRVAVDRVADDIVSENPFCLPSSAATGRALPNVFEERQPARARGRRAD